MDSRVKGFLGEFNVLYLLNNYQIKVSDFICLFGGYIGR